MKSQDLKQYNLPDSPGVYYFLKGKKILYIGKATSLKDRVKSYFVRDITMTRGPLIEKMLEEADNLRLVRTDSVLEALILEVSEIKKHQPIYNSKEKDDKSYNYVVLTKEDFPKVLVKRGKDLGKQVASIGNSRALPASGLRRDSNLPILAFWGPFPRGKELREALKIIRRIFPFRDEKCRISDSPRQGGAKPCFNAQLGLCPGPCAGWISKKDYRKIIKQLQLFFEAKKPRLIKALEREMKQLAKAERFEEADNVKKRLFALDHIQDIALIKQDVANREESAGFRIEAYDIAHLSGKNVVGVMVVVEDGRVNKSQYRKFKIKRNNPPAGGDDVGNLKEVLERRLNHPEWRWPDLVVVDGGAGQINVAKKVLKETGLKIKVVSVVKDSRHKAREVLGPSAQSQKWQKEILLANAEAHRFAIGYHRKLRGKGFRI